jgi:hypothetical protein
VQGIYAVTDVKKIFTLEENANRPPMSYKTWQPAMAKLDMQKYVQHAPIATLIINKLDKKKSNGWRFKSNWENNYMHCYAFSYAYQLFDCVCGTIFGLYLSISKVKPSIKPAKSKATSLDSVFNS